MLTFILFPFRTKNADGFFFMSRPKLSLINLEVKDMGILGGADLEFAAACAIHKDFELTPIECL
jgi:hypothetical protein